MRIRNNRFLKMFFVGFICVCMIFTFSVKRSYAFEIRDVGDGIKKWVVVTVIMLATGTQIVADNLSPEKVKKLGEMYVQYYGELVSKTGDDMKTFFIGGAETLAHIANNTITSIKGGVNISLQWINTHLIMLKGLAEQWVQNIKIVIGDIETLYIDASKDIPKNFIDQGLKEMHYFNYNNNPLDVYRKFWPNINFYENVKELKDFTLLTRNPKDNWMNGDWNGSKITDYYIKYILKSTYGYQLCYNYVTSDGAWHYPSYMDFDGILVFSNKVKVHYGSLELGLPNFGNKPLNLDGVQDYSDNILKHGIDHIGYVDPRTGSIDYDNHDTTKPLTLDYPGTISYPVPLPNSLDDSNVNVWDPTLPVVGTWDNVKHKVIDKPSDYPLDVITDTPDDIPVDDIDKNPRGDEFNPDVKGKFFLDWHEIFPFCIPWDIYAIATMFKAEPKAPYYEFDLGNAIGLKSKKIVIDLSSFDKMAELLRTLEVLLFCVGLALITRSIIRG